MLKDVNEIINIINKNNKEAYLVGGAVRDMLLKKEAHDYDITTNMSTEELEKVFPKNYPSGKAFGIITIFYNGEEYEIAHFRTDGDYADNRHCEIEFTESIEEDLKRRDFTINAMAWSEKSGIIDIFGGQNDLNNKIIRAVGNPDERFKEDGLRMLRAIRFSAQLGFDIEENTYNAIVNNAELIKNISMERVETELTKILVSDHPEKILEIFNTGIGEIIFPEFAEALRCEQNNPNHLYNVGIHTIKTLNFVPNDKILRWTMLLHDLGKPGTKTTKDGIDHFYGHDVLSRKIANDVLKRFRFSNEDIKIILDLVEKHDLYINKISKIRYLASKYDKDFFEKLKLVQLADKNGQSELNREEKIEKVLDFNKKLNEVIDDGTAIKISDLKINGDDLKELGFKGIEVGAILQELYAISLVNPNFNNRRRLLDKANSYKSKNLDELIASYKTKNHNRSKNIEENLNR